MSEGDLPLLEPGDVEPTGEASAVGGVLLAAGESSRFRDGNKLLATDEGQPLVRHAARTLVEADLAPRVAVLGCEADAVEAALAGLGFEFVHNPDYASGQATSVSRGIEAVGEVDAVVIALGDMPTVGPESVAALVDVYEAGGATALAAAHEGKRGNPVLFDRRYFEALQDVEGDTGGRQILLESAGAALVETADPGVRQDVDTRADLEALRTD